MHLFSLPLLILGTAQDEYNLIGVPFRLMDFAKDQHFKKTIFPSAPRVQPRTTSHTLYVTPVHSTGKGKIRIEQYEYDEENLLGQGFTSKVYLGRLVENARKQFAIKVVDKKKISRNKENLQLLKQQIQIHKQLQHPNIVKCHDIIQKNNFFYIVLEYCSHGTLEAFIKKHNKLKESVAISIMEQIIAGYRYLLDLKIIHRDLKPPNILKSGSNWKICDFGFSVMGKKNFMGEINVGTPAYMAPESLQKTVYSPKSDFFSLGVLCYQMLFGQTPWQHKNQKVLLQMMKDRSISKENFSSFKNKNLVSFIQKACTSNERSRMNVEQFTNFSFWKEETSPPVTKRDTLMPITSPVKPTRKDSQNIKDLSSTCSSNSTSCVPQSRIDRKTSPEEIFKGNSAVVERQLYFATLIYNLMSNSCYLIFQSPQEKQMFLAVMGKHAKYILRRVKHQTINYLCLKRWTHYCLNNPEYLQLKKQAELLDEKVKEVMNKELKRKTIITIRQVIKQFDQLTYDQNISSNCINNLKEYLGKLMQDTIARYKMAGKNYVEENNWTTQTIDYLYQYYSYVKQLLGTAQQSRIIAIKDEERDRSKLVSDFKKSVLTAKEFKSLSQLVHNINQ